MTINGTRFRRRAITVSVIVGIALFVFIHDEMMAVECRRGGVPFMERRFKEWLVANWTRSRRPSDETAIPDGTKASEVETAGYVYVYMPDGILFSYTYPDGGSVVFTVQFDRYCGFKMTNRHRFRSQDRATSP